jgi:diacylglycerol kinase
MVKPDGSIPTLPESFGCAFRGIRLALEGRNMQIHCLATVIVIILGVFFKISIPEWFEIGNRIVLVICLEAVNTAIELVADIAKPEWNEKVKNVKDIAAGAVLIAAIYAVIVAGEIFLPKIMGLFA